MTYVVAPVAAMLGAALVADRVGWSSPWLSILAGILQFVVIGRGLVAIGRPWLRTLGLVWLVALPIYGVWYGSNILSAGVLLANVAGFVLQQLYIRSVELEVYIESMITNSYLPKLGMTAFNRDLGRRVTVVHAEASRITVSDRADCARHSYTDAEAFWRANRVMEAPTSIPL